MGERRHQGWCEGLGLQGVAVECGKTSGIGGRGISAMCRTIWGFVDKTRAFIRLFCSSTEPRGILADLTCVWGFTLFLKGF